MAQRQIPGGAFIDDTGLWDRQIPGSSFVNETQFPEQGPVTSGVSLLLPVEDSIRARKSNLNITGGYPWRVFYTPEGIPGFAPWTRGSAGTLVAGQLGRALNMTGVTTSNGATCAIPGIAGSTRFTGFAIFRKNSAAGAGAGLIRDYNGGNGWSVAFSGGNGDQLRLEAANVATISSVTVGNDLFAYVSSVGPSYSYTGLLNLRTGTLVESIGSTGAASSNPAGSAVVLSISVTNNLDGELYSAGYGYFTLTQQEGRALLNKARGLFIDVLPRIWVPGSQVNRTPVTQQPNIPTAKINKNNPITAGLRFLWLPGATPTGQTIASETQNVDTYTSTGKATYWNRVAGGGTLYNERFISDINTSSVSVLYVGAPTVSSNRLGIMSQRTTSGTIFGYNLCVNTDNGLSPSPGRLRLAFSRSSSNDVVAVSSQYSKVDGKPHTWVASKTVNVANGEIWCDGNQLPIDSNSINPILPVVAVDQACYVGTLAGDNAFINNTPTYLVAVWDRKLTSTEARDLSSNPWQIFADEEKPVQPVTVTRTTQPQQATAGINGWRAWLPIGSSFASIDETGTLGQEAVNTRITSGRFGSLVETRFTTLTFPLSTEFLGDWSALAYVSYSSPATTATQMLSGGGGGSFTSFTLGWVAGSGIRLSRVGFSTIDGIPIAVPDAAIQSGIIAIVTFDSASSTLRLFTEYGEDSIVASSGDTFRRFRVGSGSGSTLWVGLGLTARVPRRISDEEARSLVKNPWAVLAKEPKDTVSPKEDRKNSVQVSRGLLWGSSETKRTVYLANLLRNNRRVQGIQNGTFSVFSQAGSLSGLNLRALACPDLCQNFINPLTGRLCQIAGTGSLQPVQDPKGFKFYRITDDRNIIFPIFDEPASTAYKAHTFIAVFRLGTSAASKEIWRARDNSGGWSVCGLTTNASGFLLMREENTSAATFDAVSDSALTAGVWYTVVGIATSTGQHLWINGEKQASIGATPTGTRRNFGGIRYGATSVITGNIDLRLGAFFTGRLSDLEASNINTPEDALMYAISAKNTTLALPL